jgi:outer membrane protein assembly factor BamB
MKSHRNVIRHSLLALAALALVGSLCKKPPAVPDKPTGASTIQVGAVETCSTKTTDPSGSNVRYEFDWDDGTTSGWGSLVTQNFVYSDTHTFAHSGSFAIKARAQNATNAMSGWSDTMRVVALSGETTLKWVYAYLSEGTDSVVFTGTVAESPAGYLYAVSDLGLLHIVTQTGAWHASYQLLEDAEFTTSPMIGSNGLAYDAADDGTLYGIRVNGTKANGVPFPDDITSALASDGTGRFYAHCGDSLFCVDSTGRRWAARTGGGTSSPVLSADGSMVVVGGDDDTIHAFATDNGSVSWSCPTGDAVNSTGAIGSDGTTYIGSDDGALYAMKPDGGEPLWQYPTGSSIPTSPVIDADGIIYFATDDGSVHAVSSTTHGAVWTHALNADQVSTGALTADGVLLLKATYSSADSLIALNTADGSPRWSAGLPSGSELDIVCSPLIDQSGTIYVTTGNALYAYWGSSGPAASAWPMFQHDMERTGKATAK